MADYDDDETFFEEDEPVKDVVGAFESGVQGVTSNPIAQPLGGDTIIVPLMVPMGANEPAVTQASADDDRPLAGLVNA
jgi:hypothetical protein